MTEMAEILTSLREAKKVLSVEYAETFCFLIEQIEAALMNMESAVKIKDETTKELTNVRFFTEIINLFSDDCGTLAVIVNTFKALWTRGGVIEEPEEFLSLFVKFEGKNSLLDESIIEFMFHVYGSTEKKLAIALSESIFGYPLPDSHFETAVLVTYSLHARSS